MSTWRSRASCRDYPPDLMYADDSARDTIAAAKTVCAACPVKRDCLTEAVEWRDEHGIRAGLTGDYRRKHRWMTVDRLLEEAQRQRIQPGGSAKFSNRVAGKSQPGDHHLLVVTMLTGRPRATYWEVAQRIGGTEASVKAYWRRHREQVMS